MVDEAPRRQTRVASCDDAVAAHDERRDQQTRANSLRRWKLCETGESSGGIQTGIPRATQTH